MNEVRINVRKERERTIVEVAGREEYVDEKTTESAEAKRTTKVWDGSKIEIREVAEAAAADATVAGNIVDQTYILGTENRCIEVARSARRKDLNEALVSEAAQIGIVATAIVEDVELTLRGKLAQWALNALGDLSGNPDFDLKKRRLLAPSFEAIRASILATSGVPLAVKIAYNNLAMSGLYAPAVEAKIRKS